MRIESGNNVHNLPILNANGLGKHVTANLECNCADSLFSITVVVTGCNNYD